MLINEYFCTFNKTKHWEMSTQGWFIDYIMKCTELRKPLVSNIIDNFGLMS